MKFSCDIVCTYIYIFLLTMNKKQIIISIGGVILLVLFWNLFYGSKSDEILLTTNVVKTDFKDEVVSSGELLAINSVSISGPAGMRKHKLNNIKIKDLIAEGTVVKKGDYVGSLDPSTLNDKIIDKQLDLDKAESEYKQIQLDTTLTLRGERNGIKNLKFEVEQKNITLEQSKYEPPATIRQEQLNLEKVTRDLIQKEENYKIKKEQSNAKMVVAATNLNKALKQLKSMEDLLKEFTIFAPENGMVTYVREWRGEKRSVGSQINFWDTRVAELPDLSKMRSQTYINEVDIRKLSVGQEVEIGLDAFPEIKLSGEVVEVANIGETKKNSDSKVFQITINLIESDSTYRPGMTTSNKILTKMIPNVLIIPIESIFVEEKISFVYKKSGIGIEKSQVKLGERNDEQVIVIKGVSEGDVIYLNEPEKSKGASIKMLK